MLYLKNSHLNKIDIWRLNSIASELSEILSYDPENNDALEYRRYVDSEIKSRNIYSKNSDAKPEESNQQHSQWTG